MSRDPERPVYCSLSDRLCSRICSSICAWVRLGILGGVRLRGRGPGSFSMDTHCCKSDSFLAAVMSSAVMTPLAWGMLKVFMQALAASTSTVSAIAMRPKVAWCPICALLMLSDINFMSFTSSISSGKLITSTISLVVEVPTSWVCSSALITLAFIFGMPTFHLVTAATRAVAAAADFVSITTSCLSVSRTSHFTGACSVFGPPHFLWKKASGFLNTSGGISQT
mmetsp:Transcript_41919/g.99847  ORF Transcript_41919/g.99847 Transcript_41919/m.99847 type:complete len:224 (+) Transcript_41919:118-789(+)